MIRASNLLEQIIEYHKILLKSACYMSIFHTFSMHFQSFKSCQCHFNNAFIETTGIELIIDEVERKSA